MAPKFVENRLQPAIPGKISAARSIRAISSSDSRWMTASIFSRRTVTRISVLPQS